MRNNGDYGDNGDSGDYGERGGGGYFQTSAISPPEPLAWRSMKSETT